ncbi:hypothetical protein LTR50_007112 [Elasticomyces elasticus]|nr:hypothetical protein LTR50_007112 [Elasticomyces elasticus]
MLFIGAQTSESTLLTSLPSARGLLKPLVHNPSASNEATHVSAANGVFSGAALGGLGIGLPDTLQETEGITAGATGILDDVATYMHLATVISATEYKAASLRWWNAAWSLARELKLGRELPQNLLSHLSRKPHPARTWTWKEALTWRWAQMGSINIRDELTLCKIYSGSSRKKPEKNGGVFGGYFTRWTVTCRSAITNRCFC